MLAAAPRRTALLAADAALALVELALVFAPVQILFTPAPALWAVLAGLLVVATGIWTIAVRRLHAPLQTALSAIQPGERRGSGPAPSPLVIQAGYLAGTRLAFISLWLRTALLTLVAALWGAIGAAGFGLPAQALLMMLWAAALVGPHLSAWRSLLWQRNSDRALLQLMQSPAAAAWHAGTDSELRLLRDTFQGRLVVTALAVTGLFAGAAVGIVATLTELPVRGQLELWWWLPPALLGATAAWIAWLRAATAPIERFIDGELGSEPGRPPRPAPRRLPIAVSRTQELEAALRTVQRLPYGLAVALWLSWIGAAGVALLAARARFAMRPTGVLQLLIPITLVMFAAALYQIPHQQATLAALWPRLTARLQRMPGRQPNWLLPLTLLLAVPVAALMILWELQLGLGSGGQPWHGWLSGAVLMVVAVTAMTLLLRDLMRPLRELHRRAEWLTSGEFAPRPGPRPEEAGGGTGEPAASREPDGNPSGEAGTACEIESEGDEIGRLAAALTAMQRALGERLLSSAHAQLLLEQQVAARTIELQRRNEELRGALANLQHAQDALLHTEHLASIGRLVAGIAHEINNPINAVVNMAAPLHEALGELASAGHPADGANLLAAETRRELPDMLRVIERGTRRTLEIVRALHSYADCTPEPLAPADLQLILTEALELVQHPAKAGVAITRTLAPLPPIWVHAGQIQQVFINLFSNALHAVASRAAEAGSGYAPQLEVQTQLDGGRVRVAVRDNGAGIPPEVRLRIFDPFFTTKDASSGSGLGLSIAHSIISRHSGTITVEAPAGGGACFTVTLPVAAPAEEGLLGAMAEDVGDALKQVRLVVAK